MARTQILTIRADYCSVQLQRLTIEVIVQSEKDAFLDGMICVHI